MLGGGGVEKSITTKSSKDIGWRCGKGRVVVSGGHDVKSQKENIK